MTVLRRHPSTAVWGYVGVLATLAGVLLAIAPTDVVVTRAPGLGGIALTVGFAVAELLVVDIRYRADNHTFSFSELLLAFGLLYFAPVPLLLAQGVGLAAVLVFHRRQPAVRLAFNLAQTAVSTLLAVITLHALAPHEADVTSRTWLAALAALAVSAATGAVAVTGAISIVERRSHLAELPRVAAFSLLGAFALGSIGLLVVVAAQHDRFAALLALLPVLVTWVTYRGYVRERTARRGVQFLYDTTSRLQAATALEPGLVHLLTETQGTFRSEVAEIAIHRPDTKGWLRVRVDEHGVTPAPEPGRSSDPPAWVPDTLEGVGVAVRDAVPGAGLLLDELGAQVAMVCRLHDHENLGMLIVARTRVGSPRYDAAELGLFTVLAHQVGVALDNGNLERSLARLTALEEELRHQATHDALTGLANRVKLRAHVEVHRAEIGAVLLVDLDDFKTINDSLGHEAGDHVLVLVAERLRRAVRPSDVVARLGGDEFAIVLGETADRAAVLEVAERIEAALDAPMAVAGNEVVIGASVGIAFPEGGDLTLEDVLRHADVAMYRAKRAGKGRWTVFDQGMDLEARQRLDMTTALRGAVTNGELLLRYQPVLHLETRDIVGFEALARWRHPTLGELLPAQFLPIADHANLLQPLGRWVLAEACAEARRWNDLLPDRRPLAIHVNLSVVQLVDAGFVAYVAYVLGENGIDPAQLVVEINEDGINRTDLGLGERVRDLKTLGVRIAIDDFGTGASSLARLPELPVDLLKLDGSFVGALGTASPRATVTRHLLSLAASLGVDTVAEGVENAAQLAALLRLGCPFGQGYHLSPALSAEDARRLLVDRLSRR